MTVDRQVNRLEVGRWIDRTGKEYIETTDMRERVDALIGLPSVER